MALLRRDERRAEHVPPLRLVPPGIRRHELRRREHEIAIALEHAAIRSSSEYEFGQIDRMRLLPDQEYTDAGWAVAPFRTDHLRPARAAIALPRGIRARHGKDAAVPGQTSLEHRGAVPERKVRGVPPVHLEMGLAEPAVEGLPRLLRRDRAGTLDRREILREHDATLELRGTRICAARKIQRAAVGPEPLPVARARRRRLADARRRVASPRVGELDDHLEARRPGGWLDAKLVRAGRHERAARPRGARTVGGRVELPLPEHRALVAGDDSGLVQLRLRPVARITGVNHSGE